MIIELLMRKLAFKMLEAEVDPSDLEGTEYGDPAEWDKEALEKLTYQQQAAEEAAKQKYFAKVGGLNMGKAKTAKEMYGAYAEKAQAEDVVLKVAGVGAAQALWLVDDAGNVLASLPLHMNTNVSPGDSVSVPSGSVAKMMQKTGISAGAAAKALSSLGKPIEPPAYKPPPVPGPITNVNLDYVLEPHATRLELQVEWAWVGSKDLTMQEALADLITELANTGNMGLAEWLMTKISPGSV